MDAAIVERKEIDKLAQAYGIVRRPAAESTPRYFRGALIRPRKE